MKAPHDKVWLLSRYERCSERYIANEQFLLTYARLPLWKRVLWGNKIITDHLERMQMDYPL